MNGCRTCGGFGNRHDPIAHDEGQDDPMTAPELSETERAFLDRPDAPESLRMRMAVAMSNAACDPAFLDIRWDYIPGPIKDAFWPTLADAALTVIRGEQ